MDWITCNACTELDGDISLCDTHKITEPETISNDAYAILALLRKEAKNYTPYEEWGDGFAAGLDAASKTVARYIERHGGKGTT